MEPSIFLQPWVPHLIFAVIGILAIIEMLKYKIRNDPGMWLDKINRDCLRAASDPDFRAREIAAADRKLIESPAPNPIRPLTDKEERQWSLIPALMLALVSSAVILLYFGLFHIMPADGLRWHVYLGWAIIVAVLGLYLFLERNRPAYDRVRHLRRKFRLQEAGHDPKAAATLREFLGYYSGKSGMWLQLAGMELAAKHYPEALAAVEESGKRRPGGVAGELTAIDEKLLLARIYLADGCLVDAEFAITEITDNYAIHGGELEARLKVCQAAIAEKRDETDRAKRLLQAARAIDTQKVGEFLENSRDLAFLRGL